MTQEQIQDLQNKVLAEPHVDAVVQAITQLNIPGVDVNALLNKGVETAATGLDTFSGLLLDKLSPQYQSIVKFVFNLLTAKLIQLEDHHQPKTRVGRWIKEIASFFSKTSAAPTSVSAS